eukprot:jgi/Ulvmu1/10091/UM006_0038.1
MRCRIDVYADSVSLSDVEVRPKCSKAAYDRISPTHIPEITIQMMLSTDAELFTVGLPLPVTELIPALAACHDANASDSNVPAPISFSVEGMAHYDSIGSLSKAAAAAYDTMSGTVDLPCNIWALLAVLKMIIEGTHVRDMFGDQSHQALDELPCSPADVLEMAMYLGCDPAADIVRRYIRDTQLAPACLSGGLGPHQAAVCHRLAALPDAEFQTAPPSGAQQALLHSPAMAALLPPCLKVKWLRAECLSRLDLTRPGPSWTTAAWQSLAFCLHAVPALAELRVRLPCGPPAAAARSTSHTCNHPSVLLSEAPHCRPATPPPGTDRVLTNEPRDTAASAAVCCAAGPSASSSQTSGKLHAAPAEQPDTRLLLANGAALGSPLAAQLSPTPASQGHAAEFEFKTSAARPAEALPKIVRSHVSTAALDTLAHIPVALPKLQLLQLHHSQIAPSQTPALASAIAFFSASLQDLTLDCWPCAAVDAEATAREFQHDFHKRVLLDAFCSLQQLHTLTVPDWGAVFGASSPGLARKLAWLGSLQSVVVASYPCGMCEEGKCVHFQADLPFKTIADCGVR